MNPYIPLTILLQFFVLPIFGQLSKSKYFSSKDGFCSTTLFIDSLGNFYREGGCEGRSNISMGVYKLLNGQIQFTFQSFDTLPPIYNTLTSPNSNDSLSTVTFLTRQGVPVPNHYFFVDAIDTSGKFFKTYILNDNGQISLNRKKYRELRLDYLENVYRRKIRVPVSDSDFTIVFNLPKLFFSYQKPRPERGNNFSLVVKADGLYDLKGKERLFISDK